MSDEKQPVLGEAGEHPLSVLLFSWMRTRLFAKAFTWGMGVIGLGLIGLEVWLGFHPIKDATDVPGFHGLFGFLAFGLAVLSGWPLGRMLRRPEDYYERRSGEVGRDD